MHPDGLRIELWSPTRRDHRVLVITERYAEDLIPEMYQHIPNQEPEHSLHGYTIWWEGELESRAFDLDLGAADGGSTFFEMLHRLGIVTTSDFPELLEWAMGSQPSNPAERETRAVYIQSLVHDVTKLRTAQPHTT